MGKICGQWLLLESHFGDTLCNQLILQNQAFNSQSPSEATKLARLYPTIPTRQLRLVGDDQAAFHEAPARQERIVRAVKFPLQRELRTAMLTGLRNDLC